MTQYDDLAFGGYRYDVRVLNAPLEVMVHRAALSAAPQPARSGMLGQLLLEDLEDVLDARAAGVHVAAWRRSVTQDWACSCGAVILPGLSAATTDGHLDFTRLRPVDRLVTAHRAERGPERFEAHCRPCGWASPAGTAEEAQLVLVAHDCAGATTR
jgi:hypothetical protein